MSISAKDVKKLRDLTGAGMMDCKKALSDSDGDMDRAVELLRKKGQKLSEKRADREANQGLVLTRISDDSKRAAALEINCETDFVARNEDFQKEAGAFLDVAFENGISTLDDLMKESVDGTTVEKTLEAMIGRIGEKIELNRLIYITSHEGTIVDYVHPGNQLAVLVEFLGEVTNEEVARDVAMQIAAMGPLTVERDQIDSSLINKELEIAKEQLVNEGKPAEIAEKAAQGKLRRFYEENVLHEQKFVKDNGITVQEYLEQNDTPLVKQFFRIQLGEEE